MRVVEADQTQEDWDVRLDIALGAENVINVVHTIEEFLHILKAVEKRKW